MKMELACVEAVIENEIAQGARQKDVAMTYAMALVSSWPTDWPRVNRAIAAKWPKGLKRIKEMAWAITRKHAHKLGCDEYHDHQAPKCCAPSCWCRSASSTRADSR